jgi:dTDP-4-dehydrorhamnose reductase
VRILVTGAGGQLGRDIVAVLERDGVAEVVAADHRALAVEDRAAVDSAVEEARPDVVIHSAALTNVDLCEEDPTQAESVNVVGTHNLVDAAERAKAHLVYVSTDYVFDGRGTRPYRESDETNPISVYGATKLGGERACSQDATIVRTSWLSGAHGSNFVTTVRSLGERPGELRFVNDQRGSPTYTADLAQAVVALAMDRRPGCFHVSNGGEASRFALAREVLAICGGDPERVVPISTAELSPPRPATRPAYSVLDNSAFESSGYPPLPPWRDGLVRLIERLSEAGP